MESLDSTRRILRVIFTVISLVLLIVFFSNIAGYTDSEVPSVFAVTDETPSR